MSGGKRHAAGTRRKVSGPSLCLRLEHNCSATKVAEAVRRPSRPRAERACAGTRESAERRALSGPPAQFHLGCRFMQAWAEPGHDGGWSATPSRAAHVAQGILPAGHPSWHVLAPWPPGLSIFGATGMLPVTQLLASPSMHWASMAHPCGWGFGASTDVVTSQLVGSRYAVLLRPSLTGLLQVESLTASGQPPARSLRPIAVEASSMSGLEEGEREAEARVNRAIEKGAEARVRNPIDFACGQTNELQSRTWRARQVCPPTILSQPPRWTQRTPRYAARSETCAKPHAFQHRLAVCGTALLRWRSDRSKRHNRHTAHNGGPAKSRARFGQLRHTHTCVLHRGSLTWWNSAISRPWKMLLPCRRTRWAGGATA